MAGKFCMGFFGGVNFGPGIFGVLFEALGIFCVLIFAPIGSSLLIEIQSISPGMFSLSQNSENKPLHVEAPPNISSPIR